MQLRETQKPEGCSLSCNIALGNRTAVDREGGEREEVGF